MNFYICIFISFIFTVLILRYFFNSSQEGLTNKKEKAQAEQKEEVQQKEDQKEREKAISTLNSSINANKKKINSLKKTDTDLNNQLDDLEKKVDCVTKGNNSHADAAKSKATQLENQKKNATNFSTNFSPP